MQRRVLSDKYLNRAARNKPTVRIFQDLKGAPPLSSLIYANIQATKFKTAARK